MIRRPVALLLVSLFAISCRSKELVSDAKVEVLGGRATLVLDGTKTELPDEVAPDTVVTRDESGRRLAYRTKAGQGRVLYRIGEGVFVGPIVGLPVDFAAAPETARALAPLWEMAKTKERRLGLAAELEREKGPSANVELLVATASIPGPGWDEVRAKAPADALEKAMWPVFMQTDPLAIARAARVVDLGTSAADKRPFVTIKAHDLGRRWVEPRAAAALLRAVLAYEPKAAGTIACDVASTRPKSLEGGGGEEAFLAEAVYLALALAPAPCVRETLLAQGLEPLDHPSFRCNEKGPLGWASDTKQDEPLCTIEQVGPILAAEGERPPRDVFTAAEARAPLVAYAALLEKGKLPDAFVAAHERRRWALVQPKTPSCEDAPPKAPCACDEATVRQNAARNAVGHVAIGVCEYDVDEAKKQIVNVTRRASE
ncbi:MAG: hypothetical protein KIT84_17745 [Labilithrix sp.]|nr:hypothetical protein [Labilithrix sp.]MCW5812877.1 hypothetical protein [Labilithrix sp.]